MSEKPPRGLHMEEGTEDLQFCTADGSREEEPHEGCGHTGIYHPPTQAAYQHVLQKASPTGGEGDQEVCTEGDEDNGCSGGREAQQSRLE